jgi:rod shape-determining protein MreC
VLIYPVQYAVNAPIKLAGGAFDHLASRRSLVQGNRRLRDENFLLRSRTQKFAALENENRRLRELLESSSDFEQAVLVADVLALETSPSSRQIVINKGSRHGVYEGQPILDAHGILGQVILVTPFTATALLLTDATHAIPVEVNRSGIRAIAVGGDSAGSLRLSFVATDADIRQGDLVVSSGLGQRFPAGHPVGYVREVETDPSEPFAHITVAPAARVGHVSEVLLVWPERQARGGAQISAVDHADPDD